MVKKKGLKGFSWQPGNYKRGASNILNINQWAHCVINLYKSRTVFTHWLWYWSLSTGSSEWKENWNFDHSPHYAYCSEEKHQTSTYWINKFSKLYFTFKRWEIISINFNINKQYTILDSKFLKWNTKKIRTFDNVGLHFACGLLCFNFYLRKEMGKYSADIHTFLAVSITQQTSKKQNLTPCLL